MKKIFSIFLFVISLVFLSCSSAFDDNTGKIDFTLPYGAVKTVRAIGVNANETEIVPQSYAFYLRFINTNTLEMKIDAGVSGDRVIVEDIDPGVWTVRALACEAEYKKELESYIKEKEQEGVDAFTEKDHTCGFIYFMGETKAQVSAGQTSNVKLNLAKVLQENEVFTGITITLAATEEKITSANYDSIMKRTTLFANYETLLGENVVEGKSVSYDIKNFTFTPLESDEIGYKPVIFTCDYDGRTYTSEPVIVPIYYDFSDSVQVAFKSEYDDDDGKVNVMQDSDFTVDVFAFPERLALTYYSEGTDMPLNVDFTSVVTSSTWTHDDKVIEPVKDSYAIKVDTSEPGTYIYSNALSLEMKSEVEEADKFVLPVTDVKSEITVTVTAPVLYSVTFVDSEGNKIETKTVKDGALVEPPVVDEKEGYTFQGWFEDTGHYKSFNFENPITEETIIHGYWTKNETPKYTITFVSEFTEIKEVIIEEGEKLENPGSLATEPVEGYVFDAWYTDKDCTTLYTFSAPVISSFILYGKWIELPKYKVTFVYGSSSDDVEVIEGKTVEPPQIGTSVGRNFDGWYTNNSFEGEKYDFATPVTTEFTLYGRYIPIEYKITYILNDGKSSEKNPKSYNVESGIITLTDPQKEHYTFAGWTTKDITGEETIIKEISSSFARDITLTATWTIESFKVTFINFSGIAIGEQSVEYKAKVTPLSAPAMEGYSFKGWYADEDLTKEFDFDTPVDSDLTIYGKWVADSNAGINVDFPEEPVTGVISFVLTSGDDILDPDSQGYYTVEQGDIISIKASFDVDPTANDIIIWTVNGIDVESDGELLELDTSTYAGYTYIVCSVYDAETQKIIFTGNLNVAVIK